MQKLSETSSGKNNKSCSIFHNESNKIKFAFFWIFYDLLCNLQDSENSNTIWDSLLPRGPWKGSGSYKYTLTLRISPQKELRSRNVVLGAAADAGGEIPASSGGGVGRGRAWGGPGVP
jgi:hypothetical protein